LGVLGAGESVVIAACNYVWMWPVSGDPTYDPHPFTGGRSFVGELAWDWDWDAGQSWVETPGVATTILTIPASSTTATKRQRVRLVEAPGAATTIRVLGKRKAPTFTDDNDESGLSGADNCLIAFVQADMLQRERQYGKAQVLQQEAIALLDQLRHLETVQQAHHVRMMPDFGFGPSHSEYF
jgi:hypothetical protein